MSFPYRPGPPPGHQAAPPPVRSEEPAYPAAGWDQPAASDGAAGSDQPAGATGHPAVDEVLRSLENAAQLPPAEQIAEFEAAHQVLRETLASIDG
jgi:hypothetical protein